VLSHFLPTLFMKFQCFILHCFIVLALKAGHVWILTFWTV
jgi:hypothetical protein